MINYIFESELREFPLLQHTMHKDRAEQFAKRNGWNVHVNSLGEERDEYDDLNPLYVIDADEYGRHLGSIRLLSTCGPTLIYDHFPDITSATKLRSPYVFECSRFCVANSKDKLTATRIMAASGKLLRKFNLIAFIGVFDERMNRLYKLLGASPDILGQQNLNGEVIFAGMWRNEVDVYKTLLESSDISDAHLEDALREKKKPEFQLPMVS